MKEFEPLIGEWHGEGEMPIEPPMKLRPAYVAFAERNAGPGEAKR